jgi:hypothetical protein
MADKTPPSPGSPAGVYGLPELSAAWKKRKAEFAPKVELGLKTAGLFLQRASQLLVPVDFGVLKASAFTRAEGKGFATVVNVGYTAFYAMFVHENVEMKQKGQPRRPPSKGNYWDPAGRGQAKFLEAPARDSANRTKMLNIVKNVCKL